jgi:hydroxyacylglutathione hydrolase
MDLPGGDEERMRESLRETVTTASPDALVRPGHGPSSTIGRELQSNPFLQDLR